MTRIVFAALAAVIIATTALAQDPAPPRFLIERIEVRNHQRVSPQLVISETLLREGQEYSETELSAASARLSRLPFLLSADFALEKGSDRGRHVLIINITETKPFFFLLDARPTLWDDSRHTIDYEVDAAAESKDAALGFRWFVGGRGVVHAGVSTRRSRHVFTTTYSAFAVGYTQYDLFGTRAFATLNIRLPFDSPAEGLISPQVVVGVPLTATQTLTLDYEDTNFRRDRTELQGITFDRQDAERVASLTWTYNTTNQPFVPTSGTIVRVTALRSMRDRASVRYFHPVPGPPPEAYAEHTNGYGADLVASHYWELTERDSVSAGVLGGWGEVDDQLNAREHSRAIRWSPTYQTVRAGYSRSLWNGDPKTGDSRVEFDARIVRRQRSVAEGREAFGSTPDRETTLQGSASWVRRSAWGTLRLGMGYSWGH